MGWNLTYFLKIDGLVQMIHFRIYRYVPFLGTFLHFRGVLNMSFFWLAVNEGWRPWWVVVCPSGLGFSEVKISGRRSGGSKSQQQFWDIFNGWVGGLGWWFLVSLRMSALRNLPLMRVFWSLTLVWTKKKSPMREGFNSFYEASSSRKRWFFRNKS